MGLRVALNASKVGMGHGLVVLKREHQRDVHVDSVSCQHLNRRNTLLRGRHFDHHVRSGHDLPEMPSFGDGGCGVVGRVWRDFETDEAVCAVAVVVHRPKDISGQLDVLDDQALDESSITDVAFSIE
jgi:hypothetical protein